MQVCWNGPHTLDPSSEDDIDGLESIKDLGSECYINGVGGLDRIVGIYRIEPTEA